MFASYREINAARAGLFYGRLLRHHEVIMSTNIWNAHTGDRLVSATLRCALCSRSSGDLVGLPGRPIQEARFFPHRPATVPSVERGVMRCSHCRGRLGVDDVEILGRAVTLHEVGGPSLREVVSRRMQASASAA
jgi:hypothetical protein